MLAALAACSARGGAAGLPDAVLADGLGAPLARAPLDTLIVTGGYGEPRSNHFHAGYDFSTGGRTGRVVRAPEDGWVERVRTSGVGYGRSLYLRARDGRLLVFGHLDAFAPALAAWADSTQRASGAYEQDLWPAAGRFAFAAGETLAWSGESGAGGPHLHLEIRRGDFALHPLRAGLGRVPAAAPRLLSLTLEPLDAESRVAGGAGPRTIALRAGGDTLEAEGRLRAVVRSASGVRGAGDAPAWSTALTWEGRTIEARLDSISWAGEMTELDALVDRGRVAGSGGLLLWAPPLFRPRFLRADASLDSAAGTLEVRRGDPPRRLELAAREPGGERVERFVVVRPPAGANAAPVAPAARAKAASPPAWTFASLPGPRVRVRVTGTPPGLADVRIERARDATWGTSATWDGRGWVAIVTGEGLPDREGFWLKGRLPDGKAWWSRGTYELWPAGLGVTASPAPGVRLPSGALDVFEYGVILARLLPPQGDAARGLEPVGPRLETQPVDLPLRNALPVTLPLAPEDSAAGVALYRRRGGGAWEWLGAGRAADGRAIAAESSFLGEFALLRDRRAPAPRVLVPPRRAPAGPYSRWALVALAGESGSGVDAKASGFVVDGVRVPTEWDGDARVLRWRPLAPPAPGRHAYELRVVDRAGNRAVRRGTFVLDSAGR